MLSWVLLVLTSLPGLATWRWLWRLGLVRDNDFPWAPKLDDERPALLISANHDWTGLA